MESDFFKTFLKIAIHLTGIALVAAIFLWQFIFYGYASESSQDFTLIVSLLVFIVAGFLAICSILNKYTISLGFGATIAIMLFFSSTQVNITDAAIHADGTISISEKYRTYPPTWLGGEEITIVKNMHGEWQEQTTLSSADGKLVKANINISYTWPDDIIIKNFNDGIEYDYTAIKGSDTIMLSLLRQIQDSNADDELMVDTDIICEAIKEADSIKICPNLTVTITKQ